MPQVVLGDVLAYLHKLCAKRHARDLTDSKLLEQFLADHDEAAFAALVHRYGPMVLGICQRIIGNSHAAEDAFQATFLTLARRAGSIRKKGSVGSWLYGVAQRIACNANAQNVTRRNRERQLVDMPGSEPLDDLTWQELKTVLDEEIGRLSEKYRAPLVLCYFEGKSHELAARELGCPKRSLTSRLARARELLRTQLVRRGVILSAAALVTTLSEKMVSAKVGAMLSITTVKAAKGVIAGKALTALGLSAGTIALAETAMKATIGISGKAMLVILALGLLVGGAGVAGYQHLGNQADESSATTIVHVAQEKVPDGQLDPSKARIEGIVVDETGRPVANAVVRDAGAGADQVPAKTAADGSFRLVLDQPTVRFRNIVASVDGGARQGLHQFDSVNFAQVAQPRIVVKPSREVTVRVVDAAKKPVSAAAIGLFDQTMLVVATETNADGSVSVRFPVDAKISHIVTLKPKVGFNYFENFNATQGRELKELPAEVSLTLEGARTVSVQALDSADKPVAGIELQPWYVHRPDKFGDANLSSAKALKYVSVRTNNDGIAVFDWIPSSLDKGVSFVHHSEQFTLPVYPHFKPESPNDPRVARMFRNVPLSGKVLTTESKPAAGILLQVEGRDERKQPVRSFGRTMADGTYSVMVAPNITYIIAVLDDHWTASSRATGNVGDNTPQKTFDIQLIKGTLLQGVVTTGPNKAPAAEKTITLYDFSGEWAGKAELMRWIRTDKDGRYAIRVGPGSFKIAGPPEDDRVLKWEEFLVKNEEAINKNYHLEGVDRRITLNGIVVSEGAQAKPINNIAVESLAGSRFNVVTDNLGQFQVKRVPGKGILYAQNAEKTLAGIVDIGETDAQVKIVLRPLRSVHGRIVDPDGKPVVGIEVKYGLFFDRGTMSRNGWGTKTDETGRYTLNGLVLGTKYAVQAVYRNTTSRQIHELQPETDKSVNLGDYVLTVAFVPPKKDEAKPPPQKKDSVSKLSPREQIDAILKEHQDREKKFYDGLREAGNDEAKVTNLNLEYQEFASKKAEVLLALIRQLGADPAAMEGIVNLVSELRHYLPDDLVRLVVQHHVAHPKMGQLCFAVMHRTREDWAEKILRAAVEKTPDNDVRGQATYALGIQHRSRALDTNKKVPQEQQDKELVEATRYFNEVIKSYAEVFSPDKKYKLSDKAAGELIRIKNVPKLRVGELAPEIVGEDIDGKPLKLSDYRGKVVLVVFWGTWCGLCMREAPHEQALLIQYQDKPFAILGVNSDTDRQKTLKICEEKQITWRSWWDGGSTSGPIQTAYNVSSWPTSYLLDQNGIIRYFDVRGDELEDAVATLLGQASSPTTK